MTLAFLAMVGSAAGIPYRGFEHSPARQTVPHKRESGQLRATPVGTDFRSRQFYSEAACDNSVGFCPDMRRLCEKTPRRRRQRLGPRKPAHPPVGRTHGTAFVQREVSIIPCRHLRR